MSTYPIDPEIHSQVPPLSQHKEVQPANPSPQQTAGSFTDLSPNDSVEFSREVHEQRGIQEALRALPETRQDRLNRIKAAIDSGTYSVSTQDVADKLIKETILNQLP